ncbi:unnamed protein product [Bursaphelenchus okinawaensis]|uniref:MAM domain-containing protein n=1 Tax=Bursaphelenchus okinawaensis TaxID=465554 RepID=A0A811LRH1_9BILA|nr:unnamed protein product [Bursaphelenchus okinawaensis]CAG9126696.1 unnamed protein product [Bursaphelenchus okinawaensis]
MLLLLIYFASQLLVYECCMPPLDSQAFVLGDFQSAARAFGDTINKVQTPIKLDAKTVKNTVVSDPIDLFCYDFDDKCRWRNIEGAGVDELDWYQGAGFLDESRLRVSTGTHLSPDGYYGIAASDRIEFPTSKAILVSDPIDCQLGQAELRFMYWTSPDVKLIICTKSMSKPAGDYDYCASAIETGDPGPAYVSIPDLAGEPFQIYVRAENFIYNSANLQGGFAIIDNIEYFGEFCPKPQLMRHKVPHSRTEPHLLSDAVVPSQADQSIIIHSNPDIHKDVCEVLDCSFNATEYCAGQVHGSGWLTTTFPTSDIIGGIPGDASRLPYNKDGSFAYIGGPQMKTRYTTKKFSVEEDLFLMFAYFKANQMGDLRVFLKREYDTKEQLLFTTPKLTLESHRWFREVRPLYPGNYEYVSQYYNELALLIRHKGFSQGDILL